MKRLYAIFLSTFISLTTYNQDKLNKYVGINIFQLPALTLNANFSFEANPYLSSLIDAGFTPNYTKAVNIDYISFFLTPHCDCANNGYDIEKQLGGYIKIGGYFNFRNSCEKYNFFHLGMFVNNSVVYESGYYREILIENPEPVIEYVEHTKYIIGLSLSAGYEFRISGKIKSNIDFQLSLPYKNYKDLYGYRNYIPGMGFKDCTEYWFPMIIWNIKYRL